MSDRSSNGDHRYKQFKQAPKALGYFPAVPPSFKQRLTTLKYQHAVVFCGQHLLHLIMRTLICGNINNLKNTLKEALGSRNQYKNSFTKDEHLHLERGNHQNYDITLLFKIVQKVCGLAPAGDECWNQFIGGDGLEFLITTLKEKRNESVHNFAIVMDDVQLADNLNKLHDLILKVTEALEERAQELGYRLYVIQRGTQMVDIEFEIAETLKIALGIIDDVKQSINESAIIEGDDGSDENEEDDELVPNNIQFDKAPEPAGAEAPGPLLEKMFEDLTRTFWEYAGDKAVVV